MPPTPDNKPRVLVELRPAFDGYAGIPQETRLLFRGLRSLRSLDVIGLLQMSQRILVRGTSAGMNFLFANRWLSEARKINRYSRVVISAAERPFQTILDRFLDFFARRMLTTELTIGTILGISKVKLSIFRTQHFEDFIWRTLFAKTLTASDFDLVTQAEQRVCSAPWDTMHKVGLSTLNILKTPLFPKLNTRGIDIFIAQTPYPGRLSSNTALVVRYHDAIPVFMPHTIAGRSLHQAMHFYALMSNVKRGAYFACVSEATRGHLLKLHPEVESRAVTIHNIVSHHYYLDETSTTKRAAGIIRSRLYSHDPQLKEAAGGLQLEPTFLTHRERETFYGRNLDPQNLRYLLVVSTIEPRKNHARLLAAWEVLKADVDPTLKLVVVGTLGWDYQMLLGNFQSWIERGDVFMLNSVPAPELRVLYRHAMATVCPSLGEGFDFSGAEAMRCGGVVMASDIAVHREIYDGAALYFDTYSTVSLVDGLNKLIYAVEASETQKSLRQLGQRVGLRYQPERILPQWDEFLARVAADRYSARSFAGLSSRSSLSLRKHGVSP
jgi:glycosyltransferase involved in cell wall biosynthesis